MMSLAPNRAIAHRMTDSDSLSAIISLSLIVGFLSMYLEFALNEL